MNKQGLQGETIGIIVAILCLIVLVLFGSNAFAAFFSNSDNEKSEDKLDEIFGTINYMEENGINLEEVFLFNPQSERYLMVVKKENKSQLCICPETNYESCLRGVCEDFKDFEINISSKVIRKNDIIFICEKGVHKILIERKNSENYVIRSNVGICDESKDVEGSLDLESPN